MTGEQIAKAILDAVNIDQAVYRLGQNKVVELPEKSPAQKTILCYSNECRMPVKRFFDVSSK